MKILITGGGGFIGSHLCRAFIERGDSVICVDNFITGFRRNLDAVIKHKKFTLIEHDISNSILLPDAIDWVLHLASLASPKFYLGYPIKTLKSGLLGTYNCLGIAKEKKAKFLFASTSEIYGDPLVHPQPEEYWGNVNSIGARSCYDESKRAGEALTYAYMRQHSLDVRCIRLFNTYGPNMRADDGRVVSNFIVQALKNEDITVYGDGTQTRSFCYVDDLIGGIFKTMKADYTGPINLGNPVEFTILELAKKVIALTGSQSRIAFLPLPEDDPRQRRPDISRAKKILSWEPKTSLDEGLSKTADYFKQSI